MTYDCPRTGVLGCPLEHGVLENTKTGVLGVLQDRQDRQDRCSQTPRTPEDMSTVAGQVFSGHKDRCSHMSSVSSLDVTCQFFKSEFKSETESI